MQMLGRSPEDNFRLQLSLIIRYDAGATGDYRVGHYRCASFATAHPQDSRTKPVADRPLINVNGVPPSS